MASHVRFAVLQYLFQATSRKDREAEYCGIPSILGIARASNFELQMQLEIARTLEFGDSKLLDEAERSHTK
jgi:hypothetical protein